uniref:Uncharacterized protein n=1 Tax=Oryza meridionalis TaxID=40149 RepID=A0A0E0CVK4_9ORYZ
MPLTDSVTAVINLPVFSVGKRIFMRNVRFFQFLGASAVPRAAIEGEFLRVWAKWKPRSAKPPLLARDVFGEMPLGRTGERLERDPHPELIEVSK